MFLQALVRRNMTLNLIVKCYFECIILSSCKDPIICSSYRIHQIYQPLENKSPRYNIISFKTLQDTVGLSLDC